MAERLAKTVPGNEDKKVFFCNSHTIIAALIGYGLALTAAFMATHYQRFRLWGLAGGIIAVIMIVSAGKV